jgi:hypothetical protein
MSSKLINVRLDQERLRKVLALRKRGLALSDVVREAIDERFSELRESTSPAEVKAIVDGIFARYPDPPDVPGRGYDVHNPRAARRAIQRKLRRTKP